MGIPETDAVPEMTGKQRSLMNLKPQEPGAPGKPGAGRPKLDPAIKAEADRIFSSATVSAARFHAETIEAALRVLEANKPKDGKPGEAIDKGDAAIITAASKSVEAVLNRTLGKVESVVKHEGSGAAEAFVDVFRALLAGREPRAVNAEIVDVAPLAVLPLSNSASPDILVGAQEKAAEPLPSPHQNSEPACQPEQLK